MYTSLRQYDKYILIWLSAIFKRSFKKSRRGSMSRVKKLMTSELSAIAAGILPTVYIMSLLCEGCVRFDQICSMCHMQIHFPRLVIRIPQFTKTISVTNIRTGDINWYVVLDCGIYQSICVEDDSGCSFGEHFIDIGEYIHNMSKYNFKLSDFVARQIKQVSDDGYPVGGPVIISIKPVASPVSLIMYASFPGGRIAGSRGVIPDWTSDTFMHTSQGSDIPLVIEVTKVRAERMTVMWSNSRSRPPPLHRFYIGYMSLTKEPLLRKYMCGLLTSDAKTAHTNPPEFIDRGRIARFWRLMSILANVSAVDGI